MTDLTIKPTNGIKRQFQSKKDSPLNPEIGFNVNSIQTDPTIKPSYRVRCEIYSKKDSTIKP